MNIQVASFFLTLSVFWGFFFYTELNLQARQICVAGAWSQHTTHSGGSRVSGVIDVSPVRQRGGRPPSSSDTTYIPVLFSQPPLEKCLPVPSIMLSSPSVFIPSSSSSSCASNPISPQRPSSIKHCNHIGSLVCVCVNHRLVLNGFLSLPLQFSVAQLNAFTLINEDIHSNNTNKELKRSWLAV